MTKIINSWLLHWDTTQENPFKQFSQTEELISFANFPDNQQSFVLFEGYLFDKHNFQVEKSAKDASRIVEYYQIYGESLFEKLRGGYSLVIWDAHRRKFIAGRDHMGQVPFYYYWDGREISLSSSIASILDRRKFESGYNRTLIAELLMNRSTDYQKTETYYENVQRLPPAYYFLIHHQTLTAYRYWNPIPAGFQWASDGEVNSFPELFEQSVSRCLSAGADSISLSGGLDSVSIAVMANKLIRRDNKKSLHAISGKYPTTGVDEGDIQEKVANTLKMPKTLLSPNEILGDESMIGRSLEYSKNSPAPNTNILESAYSGLLKISSNFNCKKVLMGTGGDELFFVYNPWADDLFSTLKLRKLFRYYQLIDEYFGSFNGKYRYSFYLQKAKLHFIKSLNRSRLSKITGFKKIIQPENFPEWISTQDKDLEENLIQRLEQPLQIFEGNNAGGYKQYIRRLLQDPYNMFFLEHRYYHAKKNGYTNLFPYFDADLMSLAYKIHPDHLLRDNLIKAPLQHFLQVNLPSLKLPSIKADYSSYTHKILRSQGKTEWEKLKSCKRLSEFGIINQLKLNQLITSYYKRENNHWYLTWMIMSNEVWLSNNLLSN